MRKMKTNPKSRNMKQILLSIAMLLCMGHAFGQTVEKLMTKYKAFPNAQYEETTEETRMSIKANKKEKRFDMNEKDYDFVLKHFKKAEQVQLTLDEEQTQQLSKDIESLKGYEMLAMQNDNTEPKTGKNLLQNMINQTFSPNYQLRVYGKVKGNEVKDILIRWDIWGKVVLGHIDCKVQKDLLTKAIFNGEMVSFDNDDAVLTDMNDVMKETDEGNALFVIDGKECPELHSLKEAQEYMEKNNFHFNNESWVVGSAVKEKYPHTDRKVVIEFTDKSKQ